MEMFAVGITAPVGSVTDPESTSRDLGTKRNRHRKHPEYSKRCFEIDSIFPVVKNGVPNINYDCVNVHWKGPPSESLRRYVLASLDWRFGERSSVLYFGPYTATIKVPGNLVPLPPGVVGGPILAVER